MRLGGTFELRANGTKNVIMQWIAVALQKMNGAETTVDGKRDCATDADVEVRGDCSQISTHVYFHSVCLRCVRVGGAGAFSILHMFWTVWFSVAVKTLDDGSLLQFGLRLIPGACVGDSGMWRGPR